MAYASIPNTPLPSEGSRRIAFANQNYSNLSGRSLDTSSIRSSGAQSKYGRKASVFMFDHISDIKVSGLGVGEKCNYWLYGKIRLLSKKWFVHCFLVIVMILYTVGGALIFLTVEGKYLSTYSSFINNINPRRSPQTHSNAIRLFLFLCYCG